MVKGLEAQTEKDFLTKTNFKIEMDIMLCRKLSRITIEMVTRAKTLLTLDCALNANARCKLSSSSQDNAHTRIQCTPFLEMENGWICNRVMNAEEEEEEIDEQCS